jgi:spore maturation protein CgeB
MVRLGYSPSVRLFEAAACAVPVISDVWKGLDEFFEPGTEILLASSTDECVEHLDALSPAESRAIGERARARVLAQHTADHRAAELEQYILDLKLNLGCGRARSIPARW